MTQGSEDARLALAYAEQIYERMMGMPISLGVKMITNSLFGDDTVNANSVANKTAYHMGIINYFAVLASFDKSHQMIGALITQDDSTARLYKTQKYGQRGCSLKDYLDAFDIQIVPDKEVASTMSLKRYAANTGRNLLIIGGAGAQKRVVDPNPDFSPAVLDSGTSAKRFR